MGDHDPGRRAGRPGCVLQIRNVRLAMSPGTRPLAGVQVEQIDFDDRGSGIVRERPSIRDDGLNDSGCRENYRRRRIPQHRRDTLIVNSNHWNRKWNCDESRFQRSQKCNDVVEPLRRQYHSPVTT